MKDTSKLAQQINPTHDTELIIRGLNRRLESYGKRMYTPDYLKTGTQIHLQQYTNIETRLFSILQRIPTPEKLTGLKGKGASAYIQINRSKKAIEALRPYMNELKTLLQKTPTWQRALDNASAQAGRKLSRKEAIAEIERESTMLKLSDYQEFLADSESVWDADPELTELLKPFRGASKGGTRQPGTKVAQSDVDALIVYLHDYRQDILQDLTKDMQHTTNEEPFEDIYKREPLDFSKNRRFFK